MVAQYQWIRDLPNYKIDYSKQKRTLPGYTKMVLKEVAEEVEAEEVTLLLTL
jgi:hypothetical protein